MQVSEIECSVTQSVTEREKWIYWLTVKLTGTARLQLVIKQRHLSHVTRDRDRELSAGINFAEQNVSDSRTCFLAKVPLLDYGRNMFCDPVDR